MRSREDDRSAVQPIRMCEDPVKEMKFRERETKSFSSTYRSGTLAGPDCVPFRGEEKGKWLSDRTTDRDVRRGTWPVSATHCLVLTAYKGPTKGLFDGLRDRVGHPLRGELDAPEGEFDASIIARLERQNTRAQTLTCDNL